MIKKRCIDEMFDDPVRRPSQAELAAQAYKPELAEVSQEKSQVGLGEIYEREYMKTAMGFEETDEGKQEQVNAFESVGAHDQQLIETAFPLPPTPVSRMQFAACTRIYAKSLTRFLISTLLRSRSCTR